MKIVVMGWGKYGQALGSLLEHNEVDFTPVDVDLPLTHKVDVLLQVVPTQFIREAMTTNARFLTPDTIIINAAKGVEKASHELPYQIIESLKFRNYYSLLGPSFAEGIVAKNPTLVSLGYSSDKYIEMIKKLLQTPYFRIQPTADYVALELAGALKNVYAILCGYADGLGLGANTRAKLITLSLQEIMKLCDAMSLSVDILASGIVGDLVLTCSSPESRNFQFGKRLATMNAEDALQQSDSTVEGFYTSQSVQALAHKHHVKLRLATLTQRLIEGGAGAKRHFYKFIESI